MTEAAVEHVDILIVGAGPVGMTLHLALGRRRPAVAAARSPPPGGAARPTRARWPCRTAPATCSNRSHSWPTRAATPIETIHISQKDGFGRTPASTAADYRLPALGYVVRYRDLAAALARRSRPAEHPAAESRNPPSSASR